MCWQTAGMFIRISKVEEDLDAHRLLVTKDRPERDMFFYNWAYSAHPEMAMTPAGTVGLGILRLLRATSRTSSGVDLAS